MTRLFFSAFALMLTLAPIARAQPREGFEARAALLSDGSAAVLRSRWGTTREQLETTLLVDGHAPIVLARGRAATSTLVAGHDALLVAVMGEDPRAPFEVRIGRGVGAAFTLGEPITFAHPGATPSAPLGVAACATPEGFTVFFQETELADPSAAHTFLANLRADGTRSGSVTEVPIPWAVGAALYNGRGFHLALFYPGDARGVRLSMVSVTREGRPEQHPDWSSAAGMIRDVHLVRGGERILALYRGGAGDRFLESDVTAIRGWGTEPPRARDRGPLAAAEHIAVGRGEPRTVVVSPR